MESRNPLAEFFEGIVSWLGLSEGAAAVLSEMYLEKYSSNEFLGTEEIAERTGYSRTNVNLIVTQLEKLGIIRSERDLSKTGRGRKRMIYTVVKDIESLVHIGKEYAKEQLQFLSGIIDSILAEEVENTISDALTKTKKEIKKIVNRLEN
ncbi:MAG: hypothetical protein BAJATHORv1_30336 [Candidatus Thorarchaeota archaeon]|nr:MAG: hypothetical protein BAJATHORv1_30336 [Candidatus Thorarchaeota archaeon]